jgi:hypothetical protein
MKRSWPIIKQVHFRGFYGQTPKVVKYLGQDILILIDIFREVLYKNVKLTNHLFNTVQFYYKLN